MLQERQGAFARARSGIQYHGSWFDLLLDEVIGICQGWSSNALIPDFGKIIIDRGNFIVCASRFASMVMEQLEIGGDYAPFGSCIIHHIFSLSSVM